MTGSVEVACSLGLADAIIDLVETGTTMKAAGLEIVGDVMSTESVLISNPRTQKTPLVKRIHQRIQGYMTAQDNCMMVYNIPVSKLALACSITPGHESPTVQPLAQAEWVSVSALVSRSGIPDIMDRLIDIGAQSILVTELVNCRFF